MVCYQIIYIRIYNFLLRKNIHLGQHLQTLYVRFQQGQRHLKILSSLFALMNGTIFQMRLEMPNR